MLGGIAHLWLLTGNLALAMEPETAAGMLARADAIKSIDPAEFNRILDSLSAESDQLSPAHRDYVRYLQGWRYVYAGNYAAAIPLLESIVKEAADATLKFRASATVANVQSLGAQYESAFSHLNTLLEKLPEVSDKGARLQGMSVAADLYMMVGEYDLAVRYAEKVMEENANGRGACRGGQVRLYALYKSGRLRADGNDMVAAIDSCMRQGETLAAHAIRMVRAQLLLEEERMNEAISVLERYYADVQALNYPRGLSEWEALMAEAYQKRGDTGAALRYALRSVEHSVKNQITEPLMSAYRVLSEVEEERGNPASALSFLKKYAAADKRYLDDVTARQLAYERVKQDTMATKLQIDSLNQENKLLQLQRQLDSKAAETSRLYIALLILVVVFIALWAYRTKRSQLYFMKLSQVDGLTGIANRPRFLQLAENALEAAHRSQQQVSVLLCDLDHFKTINDRFGHAAGDQVLRQTVLACQAHLRISDVFGRVGGEEFGIVLPGCGLEDARQRAEQLRVAVCAIVPQLQGEPCTVSASFGVACTEASGYELRQLLAHADSALYQAKAAGRDRVMPYEPGAPSPPPGAHDSLHNASRA